MDDAIESLKNAVRCNTTQEMTYTALAGIEYLKDFKAANDKVYRICPSSYNTSYLKLSKDADCLIYDEAGGYSFGPYRFGTRGEENRIFGAKPLRYLQWLTGKAFDFENWKDGYTAEFICPGDVDVSVKLSVETVKNVETRLQTYTDCLKMTVCAEQKGREENCYFYDYTHCGTKEYYFAKGYGIVKFDFTWGNVLSSTAELVSYSLPAADTDSYFQLQIGNRWEYAELNLTDENYTAKRIMEVMVGMNGKYIISDSQKFWYNGTEDEYNAFKESLNK